ERSAESAQERRNAGNIHQRHIAYRGIELGGAECRKLLFDREIDQAILDSPGVFARPPPRAVEKRGARIARHYPRAKRGEAAGELAVAARDLEHALALVDVQQSFRCRRDQRTMPVVTLAHLRVPPAGIVIPDISA